MTGPKLGTGQQRTPRTGVKQDRFTRVDESRKVAYEVLRAVSADDAYANLVLPRMLRDRRASGSSYTPAAEGDACGADVNRSRGAARRRRYTPRASGWRRGSIRKPG